MLFALEISLMGIGMVFFVLVLLTLLVSLLGRFASGGPKEKPKPETSSLLDEGSLPPAVVAVIAASLARHREDQEKEVRILSIKMVPENSWRLSYRKE